MNNYIPSPEEAYKIIEKTIKHPEKIFLELDLKTVYRDLQNGKIDAKMANIFDDKYINWKFLLDNILVIIRDNKIQSFYPVINIDEMVKGLNHLIEVNLNE